MKLCIIGNSHTICFVGAWKEMSTQYPDVGITFYASPGSYFDSMIVDKKAKVIKSSNKRVNKRFAASSGGDGAIDLTKFDVCLIVGGYHRNEVATMGVLGGQSKGRFSKQVMNAAIEDAFLSTQVSHLVPLIREISGIPLYLIHNPFPVPKQFETVNDVKNPYKPYDYENGFELTKKVIMARYNAELLQQPAETIAVPFYTKPEFGKGLRDAFPAEIEAGKAVGPNKDQFFDNGHMNPTYGALRLKGFLASQGIKPK